MTAAKLRLAQTAMGQPGPKGELCSELYVTGQTLYRLADPKGMFRLDGEKLLVAASGLHDIRSYAAPLRDGWTTMKVRDTMMLRVPADHVRLKRVYLPASPEDGVRFLVDRLWPRGASKVRAALTFWNKDVPPSTELRQWFGHEPARWAEFREKYRSELKSKSEAVEALGALARQSRVTLVFGARDEAHNEAVVLREVLLAR
jgi:uncharacterized protein YeaO (DUF488 family)